MNGLPYYKAYPRDFFEGTAGMPVELKGIYRLVLDLIYMQGGALVDEPRYIAGHLGCAVKTWTTARAKLIAAGKLFMIDGRLRNNRADKERIITTSFLEKQRINGSAPKKNKGLTEAVAKPEVSHTEPEPYKEDLPNGRSKKEARQTASPDHPGFENPPSERRSSKGQRLPTDWVLPKSWGDWAVSQGLSAHEARDQAARFRDYWVARTGKDATKADWEATWRNWVRRVLDDKKKGQPFGQPRSDPSSIDRRIAAIASVKRVSHDDADQYQREP